VHLGDLELDDAERAPMPSTSWFIERGEIVEVLTVADHRVEELAELE
jgi:hypothetical protein